jgi:hypothetical protein
MRGMEEVKETLVALVDQGRVDVLQSWVDILDDLLADISAACTAGTDVGWGRVFRLL